MALFTLLGIMGALLAPFVGFWLVTSALADLVPPVGRLWGRNDGTRRPTNAVVKLTGLALLVVSPWVAARWAEGQNGWTDPDGDGMYADTANGSYDWFDINGRDWIRAFGATSLLVLATVHLTLHAIAPRPNSETDSVDEMPDGLPWFPPEAP